MPTSSDDAGSVPVDIEASVLQCVQQHDVAQVFVAFSGGVDSTALLLAARQVLTQANFSPTQVPSLTAMYIDHGLADVEQKWVQHAEQICRQLSVALIVERVVLERTGNVEANARRARYEAFSQAVSDQSLLLTGHHQQDQTETVLLRLFQGRSLATMRAGGTLGQGAFARPLLAFPQEQLTRYVEQAKVPWIEDPSNLDTQLARNFLRHQILPRLRTYWHQLDVSVLRVAHYQNAQEQALVQALEHLDNRVSLAMVPSSRTVRLAWLRAYLASRGVFNVNDAVLSELCPPRSRFTALQLGQAQGALYCYDDFLYFEAITQGAAPTPSEIDLQRSVTLPYGTLSLSACEPTTALAIPFTGPLDVVFRQGGEIIDPPNRPKQKVKDLFQEHRIPPWRRDHYPLLFKNGRLICVPGMAVAAEFVGGVSEDDDAVRWVVAQWDEHDRRIDE